MLCMSPSHEGVAAFVEVFGTSKAPDVSLFNYLKRSWDQLDLTNIKCGFETSDDVANFCRQMLKLKHVRCDYKEFL